MTLALAEDPEKGITQEQIQQIKDTYELAKKGFGSLKEFTDAYGVIGRVLRTADDYKKAINWIIQDSVKQGQRVVEIRCACDSLIKDFKSNEKLSPEEGAIVILDSIEAACNELKEKGYEVPKVSFVALGFRGEWIENNEIVNDLNAIKKQVETIIRIASSKEYQEKYGNIGLGFDIAGPEDTGLAARDFKDIYDMIREYNSKTDMKKIGLTIHAGETSVYNRSKIDETTGTYLKEEGKEGYYSIIEAIGLGVDRIGHGIQAIRDEKTLRLLKESNVVVEICGMCNILSIPQNTEDLLEHPLEIFIEKNIPVTIATDNDAICATDINMEYLMFILTGHDRIMDWNIVKDVARTGIKSAFISNEDKEELLKEFDIKVVSIENLIKQEES